MIYQVGLIWEDILDWYWVNVPQKLCAIWKMQKLSSFCKAVRQWAKGYEVSHMGGSNFPFMDHIVLPKS